MLDTIQKTYKMGLEYSINNENKFSKNMKNKGDKNMIKFSKNS
jgi:hypothetical protein